MNALLWEAQRYQNEKSFLNTPITQDFEKVLE